MRSEFTATLVIDADRALVWDVLTDPEILGHIIHFGRWPSFDRTTAHAGAVMRGFAADGSGRLTRYVVHWDPPTRFSFGLTPSAWVWDFQLEARDGATGAHFTCRYRRRTWWEALFTSAARTESWLRERQVNTDQALARLSEEARSKIELDRLSMASRGR